MFKTDYLNHDLEGAVQVWECFLREVEFSLWKKWSISNILDEKDIWNIISNSFYILGLISIDFKG